MKNRKILSENTDIELTEILIKAENDANNAEKMNNNKLAALQRNTLFHGDVAKHLKTYLSFDDLLQLRSVSKQARQLITPKDVIAHRFLQHMPTSAHKIKGKISAGALREMYWEEEKKNNRNDICVNLRRAIKDGNIAKALAILAGQETNKNKYTMIARLNMKEMWTYLERNDHEKLLRTEMLTIIQAHYKNRHDDNINFLSIDNNGKTYLLWLCQLDRIDLMHAVVESCTFQELNAITNKCDNIAINPLLWAALKSNVTMLAFLLNFGANVNIANEHGDSPLMIAVSLDHFPAVKLLLSYNANVNQLDNTGTSALHVAIYNNNLPLLKSLLQHSNDVNVLGSCESLLNLAILQRRTSIAEFLITQKPDVNAVSNTGFTPLFIAVVYGNTSITRLLLGKHADMTRCCYFTYNHWLSHFPLQSKSTIKNLHTFLKSRWCQAHTYC
jgi:ankyrin repeat protein